MTDRIRYTATTPERVREIALTHGWNLTKAEGNAVCGYLDLILMDINLPDETVDRIVENMVDSGPVLARCFLAMELDHAVFGDRSPSESDPPDYGFTARAVGEVIDQLLPVVENQRPWLYRVAYGPEEATV